MNERVEQTKIALWLQSTLGDDYIVRYDDCESGLTRVIFRPLNKVISEVPNNEMHKGIIVQEFEASREDRLKVMAMI